VASPVDHLNLFTTIATDLTSPECKIPTCESEPRGRFFSAAMVARSAPTLTGAEKQSTLRNTRKNLTGGQAMRRIAFVAVPLIMLAMSAQARCVDGTRGGLCTEDGLSGHYVCEGGFPVCVTDPPPPPIQGTFIPKYQVISVVYAPPGSAAGGKPSSVIYGTSSTMGTTTSVGNSFKQNYNVSITSTASILILSAGSGLSFTFSNASGSTSTYDLKKTTSVTQTFTGPSLDGVNHDFDQIWLWLRPHISAVINQNNMNLTVDAPTSSAAQSLYVSQLKNPALISPQLMMELNSFGITKDDFPQILAEDPFASGDTLVPDPNRFSKLNIDYPLDPVPPKSLTRIALATRYPADLTDDIGSSGHCQAA
jgi:hypothetical protein